MTDEFARTEGTKDPEIRRLYEEANRKQECPFDNLNPETNKPVFSHGCRHWNVWYHPKPVKGSSAHIMVATKLHLRYMHEANTEALREWSEIIKTLELMFGDCYSLVDRAGGAPERNLNATTVYHLHWHFVVSDGQPVSLEQVPVEFLSLYTQLKHHAPEGVDPLEFIDDLREWVDVARAAEKGTAWPIRFKLSNMAVK